LFLFTSNSMPLVSSIEDFFLCHKSIAILNHFHSLECKSEAAK
jgi:hypothetical protein